MARLFLPRPAAFVGIAICGLTVLSGCATGSLPDADAITGQTTTDPFAALSDREATATDSTAAVALAPFSPDTWADERDKFVAGGEAELTFGDVDAALKVYREARRRDIEVFGKHDWRVVEADADITVFERLRALSADSDRQAAIDAIRGRRRAIDLSLAGHFQLAHDGFIAARDAWARVMGVDDVIYASLTHGLAKIEKLRELGRESEGHYQAALALRRSLLGDVHPRVADTYDGLGMLYIDVFDDPAQARDWLEKAVAIRRQTQGTNSTWYARSLLHLARTHIALGEPAVAVKLLDESIAVYGSQPTDESLSLFLPTMHLGRARAQLGEPDRADELLREARRIARANLAALTPYLADCLEAHVLVLRDLGRDVQADAVAARARHIRLALADRQLFQPAAAGAASVAHDPPPAEPARVSTSTHVSTSAQ